MMPVAYLAKKLDGEQADALGAVKQWEKGDRYLVCQNRLWHPRCHGKRLNHTCC